MTPVGKVAKRCWSDIPSHYPSVEIDEYVIMPDHVHGILVIEDEKINKQDDIATSIERSDIISQVVGSFKSAVSRKVHRCLGFKEFKWQKSFYDRVIRDYSELREVRKYIRNNPKRANENK